MSLTTDPYDNFNGLRIIKYLCIAVALLWAGAVLYAAIR